LSTVLVIRPRDKWQESAKMLSEQGHKVICASVIQVVYLEPPDLEEVIQDLRSGKIGTLVFASVTAVRSLARSAPEAFKNFHPSTEVVAIGPPTAKALNGMGIGEVKVPRTYTSEGLVEILKDGAGKVMMLRSDHGNAVLREGLEGRRALQELIMYSLHEDSRDSLGEALTELRAGRIDAVLHTSSLSATMAVERSRLMFGDEWPKCWKTVNAAIGPPTRDTLTSLGIDVQVVPNKATFFDLAMAVSDHLSGREIN